jgi:hypothetical protein
MILKDYLKRVMPSLSSVVFVLVCFVIASPVRAVVPAPRRRLPRVQHGGGAKRSFQSHHRRGEHCSRLVFALERR